MPGVENVPGSKFASDYGHVRWQMARCQASGKNLPSSFSLLPSLLSCVRAFLFSLLKKKKKIRGRNRLAPGSTNLSALKIQQLSPATQLPCDTLTLALRRENS